MGILLASSKCIEGKICMHNLKFYPSRLQQKLQFLLYIDGSSYTVRVYLWELSKVYLNKRKIEKPTIRITGNFPCKNDMLS